MSLPETMMYRSPHTLNLGKHCRKNIYFIYNEQTYRQVNRSPDGTKTISYHYQDHYSTELVLLKKLYLWTIAVHH